MLEMIQTEHVFTIVGKIRDFVSDFRLCWNEGNDENRPQTNEASVRSMNLINFASLLTYDQSAVRHVQKQLGMDEDEAAGFSKVRAPG